MPFVKDLSKPPTPLADPASAAPARLISVFLYSLLIVGKSKPAGLPYTSSEGCGLDSLLDCGPLLWGRSDVNACTGLITMSAAEVAMSVYILMADEVVAVIGSHRRS